MRIKTTVTFFILSFLVGMGCCKNNSEFTITNINTNEKTNYQNLHEIIYLMLDPSLWVDCDKNPATSRSCRQDRELIIVAGTTEWFKHFPETYRPRAKIVFSLDEVPADAVNRPIHVIMDTNGCNLADNEQHPACFSLDSGYPKIVFAESGAFTIPTAAHEFGHSLGLNHPGNESTFSIMSPHGRGNMVLPIDMVTLCALHSECPPHDETWCEGTFYNECRCPSESFEDSETKHKTEKLICE